MLTGDLFTVGARTGHTVLICESTQPAARCRPHAKWPSQRRQAELGNPKDLCPWRLQRGDLKGQGMLPCSSSVWKYRVRANLTISDHKTLVQRKRLDKRGGRRPKTRQQPQVSFEKLWARKTESTACKLNTFPRGKRSDP